ncbi:hypothetical protein BYT27DRAFT_7240806 [Phlegmacium glaucopus]|nr:hypothetical protein BYT27DRAFT_7240806 [Phlegmacium glaucopus]
MAAQNDPNIPTSLSSSPSPSQSEHLSSKFLRKSKFLMKSNVNVESPESTPSTNDRLPNLESPVPPLINHQPPSEMTTPVAESDIKPVTHPPCAVVHTTEKILQATRNLQESKQATPSIPLSPENQSPTTPLMEIIPPPLSHQQQVLESVALSDNKISSPQSLTQNTPLTEDQIDHAKNLVLDLLGWGVDPEYLVTSGVHPELIYRIFTDLNLRLPTNLVLFEDG